MEKETLNYITTNQLSSVMNNTKWKKMVVALTSDPSYEPEVCIKYIFDEETPLGYSPVWWHEIELEGFETIEWIKINPVHNEHLGKLVNPKLTDFTQFIRSELSHKDIPHEFEDGIFIVYGYKRSN